VIAVTISDCDRRLRAQWEEKRNQIEARLAEFKEVRGRGQRAVFEELCFCLLTPQSSALAADRAMRHMTRTGLLYRGSTEQIAKVISGSGILYGDNKARFLVEAREKLVEGRDGSPSLDDMLIEDPFNARENVVKNVKGLGYKEASHFLRNIGYEGLAILDRHILRTMCEGGVVDSLPKTISRKTYLDLERRFLEYSKRLGIPSDALDMLMWSARTGRIFK
jgi:N-glycosylase/DNA lyase